MWPFENDDYPEGHLLLADQGKPNNPRRYYARPHGVAVLHYRDGEPFAADNIRLPDGSRGKARLAPRTSHWRRPLNDQKRAWTSAATAIPIHWRWGALIVAPDDLIFEDNQSLPEISFDGRNERFDRDLCQSQEIKDLALTVEGCHALYTELRSGVWMPFSEDQPVLENERDPEQRYTPYTKKEAARTLAKIRHLGETYDDFLDSGWLKHYRGYLDEYLSIRRQIKRLGWCDILERPEQTAAPENRVDPPAGFREYMRQLTIFVIASVLAVHVLIAALTLLGH